MNNQETGLAFGPCRLCGHGFAVPGVRMPWACASCGTDRNDLAWLGSGPPEDSIDIAVTPERLRPRPSPQPICRRSAADGLSNVIPVNEGKNGRDNRCVQRSASPAT